MTKVIITKGFNEGLKGTILEVGTFESFGRKVEGARIDLGKALPMIFNSDEYEEIEEKEIRMPDRFSRGNIR